MHAISHSLAHRGPGASRARSRWQPYSSTLNPASSVQTRSPTIYLHTPASSILSASPATYISPACLSDPPRKHAPVPISSQASQGGSLRDVHKNKHVTRLVDQAVKSLCDIWHPEDIPTVFRMTSPTTASTLSPCDNSTAPGEVALMQLHLRNPQLPSPVSPTTQPSPMYSPATMLNPSAPSGCLHSDHLLPVRGFVHEVLRRSRTSTGVLQTALCYLEAVRSKVPGILQKELLRQSDADADNEESIERIILGSVLDGDDFAVSDEQSGPTTACKDGFQHMDAPASTTYVADGLLTAPPTELISADDTEIANPPPLSTASSKTPSAPLPPLPRQPSPLLCPRRTFLACLILASKFMQDRSYSNKAWAKLAGLPPREIGRCERALGEALEWRLWVGKGTSTPSSASNTAHRAVVRCKSELVISRSPTCAWPTPTTPAAMYTSHVSAVRCPNRGLSNLRRSATMPDLESSGYALDGFAYTSDALPSISLATPCAVEATLIAEPDMDEFDAVGSLLPIAAWNAPLIQASLYAGDITSPSLSTPGLAYSPMSTSSTSSSDDGDRTINLAFQPAASFGYPEYDLPAGKLCTNHAAEYSPFNFSDAAHCNGTASSSSFVPYVVNDPSRLAPPSEAIFNPVLLERAVGNHPGMHGSFSFGAHANSYSNSVNWSVSGAH